MIVNLYRKYIPENIRTSIYNLFLKDLLLFIRSPFFAIQKIFLVSKIEAFYKKNLDKCSDEYKESLQFIKNYGIHTFPNDFINKYKDLKVQVYYSEEHKMYYVIHENKKLFFSRKYTKSQVIGYYRSLLLEQDCNSPHVYTSKDFQLESESVIFDVGTAEGFFSLLNIEKASHIYLFECENEWIDALKATFAPWIHKITIVQAFVSDKNSDNSIVLGDYIKKNEIKVDFIKMDIEGWEVPSLKASIDSLTLVNNELLLSVCCYHRASDEKNITAILKSANFECKTSKGLMLVCDVDAKTIKAPYFRKGVIYARKKL